MVNSMVMELSLGRMVKIMWENGKMGKDMVKVHLLLLMEEFTLENGRINNKMVKED